MATVSDILQRAYRSLGELQTSLATGGSTTTVIDTTQIGAAYDGAFKNCAMFISRDAGGAAAAPEGEFSRISAYADNTGTFTMGALTVAVAAGDRYAVAGLRYPLQLAIQRLNDALSDLGDVDLVDTTTLDSAASTSEYAAAVAWKRPRPLRVDVQGRTGATTTDNQWREWHNWEYVPAAAGVAGKIILPGYAVSSRDIRVWYRGPHGTVNAYSDVINESFNPTVVVAALEASLLEWENTGRNGADPFRLQRGQKAEQKVLETQVQFPQGRVKSRSKLLVVRGSGWVDDDYIPPPV